MLLCCLFIVTLYVSGSYCNDEVYVLQIESTYNTRAGAINRCIASTESRIEAVRAGGGEVKRQDRTAVCPNDATCSKILYSFYS